MGVCIYVYIYIRACIYVCMSVCWGAYNKSKKIRINESQVTEINMKVKHLKHNQPIKFNNENNATI